MRTTLNIDETLLGEAMNAAGLKEKTAVIHLGLQALIRQKAARRLGALGGSMPGLEVPSRRRSHSRRPAHGAC